MRVARLLAGLCPLLVTPIPAPSTLATSIDMHTLHAHGGVPPGWSFTVPPGDPKAGRQSFLELGCHQCHRVDGQGFPEPDEAEPRIGPELTDMGRHHPRAYFFESIVHPSAVTIEGPGYVDDRGHSTMPSYGDAPLSVLLDVTAFLESLGGPYRESVPARSVPLPAPPQGSAGLFLAQEYTVLPDALAAFELWFAEEGRAALLAIDGLVSVETWVDRMSSPPKLRTVFSFRDLPGLMSFLHNPRHQEVGATFDGFVGEHDHRVVHAPPIYRAESLSAIR